MFWFVLFGWLSDRVGRKGPIVIGYALTIVLMFPLFHWMASAANPELSAAMRRIRWSSPAATAPTPLRQGPADRMRQIARRSVEEGHRLYDRGGAPGHPPQVTIGGVAVDASDPASLDFGLRMAGYKLEKSAPSFGQALQVVLAIVLIGLCSGMTYGPVAALLVELFPARIRYTSMSIPYPYRHRLFRRIPALHQPVYRRQDRRSLRRPLVHDRGGGDGAGGHLVLAARDRGEGAGIVIGVRPHEGWGPVGSPPATGNWCLSPITVRLSPAGIPAFAGMTGCPNCRDGRYPPSVPQPHSPCA
jgi:hypothetical protein